MASLRISRFTVSAWGIRRLTFSSASRRCSTAASPSVICTLNLGLSMAHLCISGSPRGNDLDLPRSHMCGLAHNHKCAQDLPMFRRLIEAIAFTARLPAAYISLLIGLVLGMLALIEAIARRLPG